MPKFVDKWLVWDLAAQGDEVPMEFGDHNKGYPLPEPEPPPAPRKRRGRLRRLFARAPAADLSATIDDRTSVSVRIEHCDKTYHANQGRFAIRVRLKRLERIERLLFLVYKDYDPDDDDPDPRPANVIYREVLTQAQLRALPDANPTDDDGPNADITWVDALGPPPDPDAPNRVFRMVVWVTSKEDNLWAAGADPVLDYGREVHDRALHPDLDPDTLRDELAHAAGQPGGETPEGSDRAWYQITAKLRQRVKYLSDLLGRNLTRMPILRTLRVVHLAVKTTIESDERYARADDDSLEESPAQLAALVRQALADAVAALADGAQPEAALLRANAYAPLRLFMAPEWFFRPYDRAYTRAERDAVYAELDAIAADYPDWVLLPGTIFWTPTDDDVSPKHVFNECPIYVFGELDRSLFKVNEHDLTQAAKDTASQVWGMNDLDASGLEDAEADAIRDQSSQLTITPDDEFGDVEMIVDICRDQNRGVGLYQHMLADGDGVHLHVLVSAETTRLDNYVAARDQGLFVHLDGDNDTSDVLRVARTHTVQELRDVHQEMLDANGEQDDLYRDVEEADDALNVVKDDERFAGLDAECRAMVAAWTPEEQADDGVVPAHDRPARRWSLFADSIRDARAGDASYADDVAEAVDASEQAQELLRSSDARQRAAAADRELSGAVKCDDLADAHLREAPLIVYNLAELP